MAGNDLVWQEIPATTPVEGAVADKAAAEVVCGRPLPQDLFEWDLEGRRIIVVRELTETRIGSIIVPDTVQDKWPKSAGWVISAGPQVGTFEPGLKGLCRYSPEELLLKKVLFARYTGIGIPVTGEDGRTQGSSSEYGADFIMMRDEDILAYRREVK